MTIYFRSLFTKKDRALHPNKSLFDFVYSLIIRHDLVVESWDSYKRIAGLSEKEQEWAYIRIYREFEQFIVTNIPPVVTQEFTKQTLRETVAQKIDIEKIPISLRLLFTKGNTQYILVFQVMSQPLVDAFLHSFGFGKLQEIVKNAVENTILANVQVTERGIIYQPLLSQLQTVQKDDLGRVLKTLYNVLFYELNSLLGNAMVKNIIIKSFISLKDTYDHELLRIFFDFVPENILETERWSYLTQQELAQKVAEGTEELRKAKQNLETINESLEIKVAERTKELQAKFNELEKTNQLMVGREMKMIELKNEIVLLKQKLEQAGR